MEREFLPREGCRIQVGATGRDQDVGEEGQLELVDSEWELASGALVHADL